MTNISAPGGRGVRRRPARGSGNGESACRRILERDPHNGDAAYQLGVMAAARGNYAQAAMLMVRAIQADGPAARYCAGLAGVLRAQGKYRQAAACYQQALNGAPGDAVLLIGLAHALLEDSRPAESAGVLAKLLTSRTDLPEGWRLLGSAFYCLGSYAESAAALVRATALDPGCAEGHYDLGIVLVRLGRAPEAENAYRRAVELRPDFPEALNNLANLVRSSGRAREALPYYRRALRRRPDFAEASYNLGLTLQSLGSLEEAASRYRDALAHHPAFAAAHNNLANTLLAMGAARQSLPHYLEAVRLEPGNREFRVNLGMAQLLLRDFAGWRNYAARTGPGDGSTLAAGPPEGRRVLLLPEQGFGDTLQFIRYIPMLRDRGNSVVLSAPPALARLLAALPEIDALCLDGNEPPRCDASLPLLHLPGMFTADPEAIPSRVPYLAADPELARSWAACLRLPATHLKVGIAWRGSPEHRNDRNRSIEPAGLAALAGLSGVTFISLQKDHPAGCEIGGLPFEPLGRELTDFADTAALMMNLDLVISVDTAVAHLAGALARPVWTLLPFAPDWRWMLERSGTPWYPTMRLFRQKRRGDWRTVLERVRKELAALRR